MTSTSVAYRDGNFSEIFEVAKSNRLTQEETVKYSDSLQRLLDMKASVDFLKEKYARESEKKAEKRFEEGRLEERKNNIRSLLMLKMSPEQIAVAFNLTVEEVMQLAEEN